MSLVPQPVAIDAVRKFLQGGPQDFAHRQRTPAQYVLLLCGKNGLLRATTRYLMYFASFLARVSRFG